MDAALLAVIAIVTIALVFGFTNGFHDAANAIATSIGTRALTPHIALLIAASMNLVGALISTGVAKTVSSGIIVTPEGNIGMAVIFAAVAGAIFWNLLTWWFGLPSSSSHALIGGLVGGALAATTGVQWDGVVTDVLLPMVLSPLIGFTLAFALHTGIMWFFHRTQQTGAVNRGLGLVQTLSAAGVAFGHGLQDAQKTMGVIVLALVSIGYQDSFDVPLWVVLSAATAMAAGTYAGGWRIIRTLSRRVVHLDPPRGFAAEATAASVLYLTAAVEVPVSTTHTITSAIMGAGATRRISAVRWGLVRTIFMGWVFTLPGAATAAALVFFAIDLALPSI